MEEGYDSDRSYVTEISDGCTSMTPGDYNMLMNTTTSAAVDDRGKRLVQVLQMINQKNVHQPNRIDDGIEGLKVNTAHNIHTTHLTKHK
jgi:hypothetical protein